MVKLITSMAVMALTICLIGAAGAERTMQDVLEERLKELADEAQAAAGLPLIVSQTPTVEVQQETRVSGDVSDEAAATSAAPSKCSCEPSQDFADPLPVEDESASKKITKKAKKAKTEKQKKYKVITIALPDDETPEADGLADIPPAEKEEKPSETVKKESAGSSNLEAKDKSSNSGADVPKLEGEKNAKKEKNKKSKSGGSNNKRDKRDTKGGKGKSKNKSKRSSDSQSKDSGRTKNKKNKNKK